MRRCIWIACLATVLAGAQTLHADVWDLDTLAKDDGTSSGNELTHGVIQVHDLAADGGVVDQDWYRLVNRSYVSYEVVVEGLTGDLSSGGLPVERIANDGTTVVQTSTALGGATRTMRWQNVTGPLNEYIRVTGSASECTITCTTDDQYTIRFYETTGFIPRFNNSGTQITVLMLQNTSFVTITGNVYYFTATGSLAGSDAFSIPPRGLAVIATQNTVPGVSGSVRVTHTGGYGELQGKTVALEPSTGFSFDTPMQYKGH